MTAFLFVLGVAALVFILWLMAGIRRIGAISTGQPIGDRTGTALILIDLQQVFWDHGPYAEAAKTAARTVILDEVETAKTKGFPIIALRQEWSIPATRMVARLFMKGQAIAGTAGTELAAPFAGLADHVLIKRVQDAFDTAELDALLREFGVGQIRIVGLDFNHCVQKTALAARNRGVDVTIVQHGTLAAAPIKDATNRLTARDVVLQ
ncbi:cysteine hydrolase family protein [Paracoccus tegillarcae]|uniref:Cysteine hydrolase n=1 Tax=Paracoccus tegillarcae TaxID=1529068 RepID=A0A2K9EPB8_9RHOB|nr:cysteine hydrolase [Paracoccus tegillarcae]AUH33505.1 cysteine hydrolase [Paracoccus tegillarcae]